MADSWMHGHRAERAAARVRLALWVLVSAAAAPVVTAEPQHLLWSVTGPAGVAHLTGSIHFGRPGMYPLAPAVERAFAQADTLVVEIDVLDLDPEVALGAIAREGMYTDGSTLEQHLDPHTWRALEEVSERHGIPLALVERQKPWLAAITITTLELTRGGLSEMHGVDRYFLARARGEKQVIELESFESQIAMFQQLDAAEQERMLRATLADVEAGPRFFEATVEAWARGDVERLDRLVNGSFRAADPSGRLYELIMSDRNRAMAARIAELVDSGGSHFVVVGAGHLVGDDSVVELLAEHGYRVDRR